VQNFVILKKNLKYFHRYRKVLGFLSMINRDTYKFAMHLPMFYPGFSVTQNPIKIVSYNFNPRIILLEQ
jgi:hypothetical protein